MGRRVKVVNLLVDTYQNYLGIDKGCLILRDKTRKNKNTRFPPKTTKNLSQASKH